MIERLPFTPLIIIGAGRSGTNILRDVLTKLPGFSTWDCDEINPIWRHGNISWANDEFSPDLARPDVQCFVRKAFFKLWKQKGFPAFVVEKTCANSLRVPFVDAILPEARYIHIVRDGVDVVASARRRWQGNLEVPALRYLFAKARYTPMLDLPIYGLSFLQKRVDMALGKSKRLSSWGPRFALMDDLYEVDLDELCALQWVACVDRADEAFTRLKRDRVLQLRYEDFINNAEQSLWAITKFLNVEVSSYEISNAASVVRSGSVGKGRRGALNINEQLMAILHSTMERHGYEV